MNCQTIQSKLNRYLDGELSVRERHQVEEHLADCASCRDELERLRSAAVALAAVPQPPDIPAGFADRTVARARKQRTADRRILTFWPSFSPALRFAAAAMVVLGISLGTLMSRDLVQDRNAATNVAATELEASDELDYFTGDIPDGSLADSYLALAEGRGDR